MNLKVVENDKTNMPPAETSVIEKVMIDGDLSNLTSKERIDYYGMVCKSLKLNPLTKPFEYIKLNGKLTLYVRKDTTEQLRNIHNVSINALETKTINDIYIVTSLGTKNGRQDMATGAVNISNLKGEVLANAFMKAETKSKRRLTLSLVGLGWLDESEIDSIPNAKIVTVDEAHTQTIPSNERKSINNLSETIEDIKSKYMEYLEPIDTLSKLEIASSKMELKYKGNPELYKELKEITDIKRQQIAAKNSDVSKHTDWISDYESGDAK